MCVKLFLWGSVWIFWAVSLAIVFAMYLAIPLTVALVECQAVFSLDLYFCLVDSSPPLLTLW